jgi:hypothetical protein
MPYNRELRSTISVERSEKSKYAGIYETNKEAVGQTDDENRSDLFRVHLLRRRGLIERDYLTPKTPE